MAIAITETSDSRAQTIGKGASLTRRYHVTGASEDETSLRLYLNSALANPLSGLYWETYDLEPTEDYTQWFVNVPYTVTGNQEDSKENDATPADRKMQFNGNVVTHLIREAISVSDVKSDPDAGNAILGERINVQNGETLGV